MQGGARGRRHLGLDARTRQVNRVVARARALRATVRDDEVLTERDRVPDLGVEGKHAQEPAFEGPRAGKTRVGEAEPMGVLRSVSRGARSLSEEERVGADANAAEGRRSGGADVAARPRKSARADHRVDPVHGTRAEFGAGRVGNDRGFRKDGVLRAAVETRQKKGRADERENETMRRLHGNSFASPTSSESRLRNGARKRPFWNSIAKDARRVSTTGKEYVARSGRT